MSSLNFFIIDHVPQATTKTSKLLRRTVSEMPVEPKIQPDYKLVRRRSMLDMHSMPSNISKTISDNVACHKVCYPHDTTNISKSQSFARRKNSMLLHSIHQICTALTEQPNAFDLDVFADVKQYIHNKNLVHGIKLQHIEITQMLKEMRKRDLTEREIFRLRGIQLSIQKIIEDSQEVVTE
jgi:hypothetical protein